MNEAQKRFSSARTTGKIIPPIKCSNCGTVGVVHGHHRDYRRAFYIVWLCAKCHALEHCGQRVKAPSNILHPAKRGTIPQVLLDKDVVKQLKRIVKAMSGSVIKTNLTAVTNFILAKHGIPQFVQSEFYKDATK